MRRVLDELADALSMAQGTPSRRRIAGSVELRHQFGLPITPGRWEALEARLACALPPLERRSEGLWSFPHGWKTVWDLAAYLADNYQGWLAPRDRSAADWREARVFVRVRACLVEALNVDPELVVRPARLIADLGAE
jgi:hypothetical protein